MKHDISKGLNPEQKKAVIHDEGPLLIIAGAGTGKTTVITRRIAHLIVNKKIKPSEILALTFTDKAASQMQEKVDVAVPYGFTDTWIYTFHAFGDRVLRENALELGFNSDFQVLTRPQTVVFFREHLFKFSLDYYRPLGTPTKFIESILSVFSRSRDEDISVEEYLKYAQRLKMESAQNPDDAALQETALRQTEIARCYEEYQKLLLKEGKIDFANLFYLTLKLFRQRPSVLKYYQEQFKYILIDEFQDTNYAQFELVKLLAGRTTNLTVVADDDQSIYKWRGAAVSNILQFMKVYPDSEKIALTRNYRSTQPILDSSYQLIQNNNPDRFEVQAKINKRLIGKSKKGKSVKHMHFDTLSSESDWVAQTIARMVKSKKYDYGDFAILVRSNSDADPFLRALNLREIPWQFSGNQGLYARDEVRICIAFLRLIADPKDSLSLFYLAGSPLYHIPIMELTQVMNCARRGQWDLFYALKRAEQLEGFHDISPEFLNTKNQLIKTIEEYIELSALNSAGKLLYLFLTQSGYLKSLVENPTPESEERIKNIAKFFELVREFERVSKEDRVIYFVNYLDALISAGDDPAVAQADRDACAVNVLTIHKAKGLEFPVVFLVSLVEGRFPWPLRRDPIELPIELIKDILPMGDFHIQEERRLFYVGMTRAKKELYLTSASDYGTQRQRKVSRFVVEAVGNVKDIKMNKASALESIERSAPKVVRNKKTNAAWTDDRILSLSHFQIDDYVTCPLKYKFIHILRVPIMAHHTVLFGRAIHESIQLYHLNKMRNIKTTEGQLIRVFEDSFKKEGFLSREHLDLRLSEGIRALQNFYRAQENSGIAPAYAERDFSFTVGNNRVAGRWDRIDVRDGKAVIIDFKSSKVAKKEDADKRAKDSRQLSIYSLAYEKIFNETPDSKELQFLETGVVGRAAVTAESHEKVLREIDAVSAGIRSGNFEAKPNWNACFYCAFNQICPSAQSHHQ